MDRGFSHQSLLGWFLHRLLVDFQANPAPVQMEDTEGPMGHIKEADIVR